MNDAGRERVPERGSRAAELVAEFLDSDPHGAPDAWLARLDDAAERALFLELFEGARTAARVLPRALGAGALLCDRYRVVGRLAEGGQGGIYVADDLLLGRQVALKVLAPHARGDPESEALLAKESRLLAALRHPNIVVVHELAHDGDLALLVMDLVDGTSIADVVERARRELAGGARRDGRLLERAIGRAEPAGRASLIEPDSWWRSVARVMHEIARTLEASHAADVIHRDLKPANVMLQGGGIPVVLDFGLAGNRALQAGAMTQELHGSVPYLAPEQARSHTIGTDPRSDVYQLGLVLYELLTLDRAFPGTAIGDVLERIRNGEMRAPRQVVGDVPRELEAICLFACEAEPERRYESARDLALDLERWLAGAPTVAERAGWTRRALQRSHVFARRHPWRTAGPLALVAGAVAFLLVPTGATVQRPGFFSYDTRTGRFPALPSRGGEVRVGDFLGIHVDGDRERVFYALSTFGERGEVLLAPWRPATPKDADRMGREGEPWGLVVPAGKQNILCVELRAGEVAPHEGLIVFESDVARPEIEQWFDRLGEATRREGIDREGAVRLLERSLSPARGIPPREARTWSEAEKKQLLAGLASGRAPESGRVFDLPGVEEHVLECSVAE